MNENKIESMLNGINFKSIKKDLLYSLISNCYFDCKPNHFLTVNVDFLSIASKDKYFHEICVNSDLNFIDGTPVQWLIRIKYGIKIDRITGFDVFVKSLDFANDNYSRVALVGATPEILNETAKKITANFKNITLQTLSPLIMLEDEGENEFLIIEKLKAFQPDFLFVALGCPKQEKWINKIKYEVNAKINVGIGGVFNVFSGQDNRAPTIIQNIGLEWFWRLMLSPRKYYKRYLLNDLPFYLKSLIFEIKNALLN